MFNFKFLEKFENFNEKSGGADYDDDNLGHGLPLSLLQVQILLDEAAVAVDANVVTVVPQHPHHHQHCIVNIFSLKFCLDNK